MVPVESQYRVTHRPIHSASSQIVSPEVKRIPGKGCAWMSAAQYLPVAVSCIAANALAQTRTLTRQTRHNVFPGIFRRLADMVASFTMKPPRYGSLVWNFRFDFPADG
jgi:hypothetical protein